MNTNNRFQKPLSRNAAYAILAMPFFLIAIFIGICATNQDFSMLADMSAPVAIASPAYLRAIQRLQEQN